MARLFRTASIVLLGAALAGWVFAAPPTDAPAEEMRDVPLSVERADEGSEDVEVTVTASPLPVGGGEDLRWTVVPPVEASIRLPAGRRWRLRAEAPGLWSAPRTVEPVRTDPDGEPLRLILWPATSLEAKLIHDGEPAPIDRLGVLVEVDSGAVRSPGRQPQGGAEIECPVAEGRLAGCAIPSGRWHLRLRAEGFAPHTLWNVRTEASRPLDLGTLSLERGGSVFGRVVTTEGPADPRTAEVELRPLVGERGALDAEEEAALERMTRTAELDAQGHFQIVGIPEGLFTVEASQPGFASAVRSPVEVATEEWTELEEPLVLERLLHLVVEVRPATGALEAPWSIELYRFQEGTGLTGVAQAEASPDGLWRSPPLAAGRYAVRILDAEESTFAWREVELVNTGPEDQTVLLELPLVFVEGRVRLGREPLAARLQFQRTGEGGAKVEAESDEEGTFFLVLPGEGEWEVFVRSESPPVAVRGLAVDVESRGEDRVAQATVEVPDTRISGVVVDPEGLPPSSIARVEVLPAQADRKPTFVDADAAGRFELLGLRPGSYLVQAVAGEVSADGVLTEVVEGLETPLRLVLHPKRTVVGRVISESGPVAGAEVLAAELTGPGRSPTLDMPRVVTGIDGRFRFRVRAGVDRLRLVTLARGYTLAVREVVEGSPVEVPLSRDGGLLRLPAVRTDAGEDGTIPIVLVDGVPFGLPLLTRWARRQGEDPGAGGTVVVPGMPPGGYARCRLELWEAVLIHTGAALPATGACTEGYLPPGGELTLGPPG